MIISHKYEFVFIKTLKTAGTSIEVFLSQHCGQKDILTPIIPPVYPHVARNYRGIVNPISEIVANRGRGVTTTLKNFCRFRRFYNHMPAKVVRLRVTASVWQKYYKFCVERNPWDKTLSHYHMLRSRSGGRLSLDEYFRSGDFCINYGKYTDNKGNLLVDRILRYENLQQGLGEVFALLGIPFSGDLGINAKSEYRTDRTPYQEVFSGEENWKIAEIFKPEIEMHGYSF